MEKPFAASLADADRMIKASGKYREETTSHQLASTLATW